MQKLFGLGSVRRSRLWIRLRSLSRGVTDLLTRWSEGDRAAVAELKYFGGLNYDEMAEVLKISPVTVRRDWRFAKAWLFTQLQNAD